LGESNKEYKAGTDALAQKNYAEAISHLEKAITLNPSNSQAELKVANVYAEVYKSGVEERSNTDLSDLAIQHYRKVIDDGFSPATSIPAAKGLGNLYLKMGKFDDAKQVYAQPRTFNPNDAEPHYWIAVIDWAASSQVRQKQQAKLGMKAGEILAVKNIEVCGKVSDANYSNIDEGINQLNRALELDPEFEDAMNYMNLMYRERAEIRCNDPALRATDLKTAAEWTQKLAAVKKMKAARGPAAKED
jgi:tetratricopeptide (TPR) repeat protein